MKNTTLIMAEKQNVEAVHEEEHEDYELAAAELEQRARVEPRPSGWISK